MISILFHAHTLEIVVCYGFPNCFRVDRDTEELDDVREHPLSVATHLLVPDKEKIITLGDRRIKPTSDMLAPIPEGVDFSPDKRCDKIVETLRDEPVIAPLKFIVRYDDISWIAHEVDGLFIFPVIPLMCPEQSPTAGQ